MDRIMDTDDPQKRMELMQEHRQQLQETMGMMSSLQQGSGMGMMGGQMDCVGMMEAYRQMDKRLDLMQKLLEQRLDK